MTLDYPIDLNGFLVLKLEPSAPGHIKAYLFSTYSGESSPVVKNILPLISIETAGGDFTPRSARFDIALGSENGSFDLKINKMKDDRPYATFTLADGEVKLKQWNRKLCVSEMQIIGRAPQDEVPGFVDYSGIVEPNQITQSYDLIQTQVMDQHTHLSAQASGDDLIEIGLRKKHAYPTAILDKLGIVYSQPQDGYVQVEKRNFLPYARLGASSEPTERGIRLSDLKEDERRKLSQAFGLSPESQSTPGDMERTYFHREPFTKDITLLEEMLHTVVEGYCKQGVRYAELSSNAALPSSKATPHGIDLNPQWLEEIERVMAQDAIRKSGVAIKFRSGMPRNLSEDELMLRAEIYHSIAAHPLSAGPDILGVEANKTSDLYLVLQTMFARMEREQPENIRDSVQLHAGENGKNPRNVQDGLRLAREYNIILHCGHALYGMNDETLDLARSLPKGNVYLQYNHVSNIAGDNVDWLRQINIARMLDEGFNCLLNSDGAGIYYADPVQNAMAGALSGMQPRHFTQVRKISNDWIARQEYITQEKAARLPKHFFPAIRNTHPVIERREKSPEPVRPEPVSAEMEAAIAGKRPFLFLGSGGSGWEIDHPDTRRDFILGFKLLIKYLNPARAYFLTGRIKTDGGIGLEMLKANNEFGNRFIIGSLLADNESAENHLFDADFTRGLPTAFVGLPGALTAVLKEEDGTPILCSGKAFTRWFATEFIREGIDTALMNCKPRSDGTIPASAEKADVFKRHERAHVFEGAVGMLKCIMNRHPEVFQHLPGEKEIEAAYRAFGEEYLDPVTGKGNSTEIIRGR